MSSPQIPAHPDQPLSPHLALSQPMSSCRAKNQLNWAPMTRLTQRALLPTPNQKAQRSACQLRQLNRYRVYRGDHLFRPMLIPMKIVQQRRP